MNPREIPIADLIPQRPPFVLIDRLTRHGEDFAESEFLVSGDHIMIIDGALTAEGLVENIAQTAAAHLGFINYSASYPPAIGYIGAVSNLITHALPPVGSEIKTIIKIERRVLNASIIQGSSYLGSSLLAECQLKIFLDDKQV